MIRRREWIRLHVATAFPSSVTRKKHDFVKTQKTIEKFRSSSRVARYWQPRPSRRKFVQVFLDSPFLNRFSWLRYQNVRLEKLKGALVGHILIRAQTRALSARQNAPTAAWQDQAGVGDPPVQATLRADSALAWARIKMCPTKAPLNFLRRTFWYLNHENRLRKSESRKT